MKKYFWFILLLCLSTKYCFADTSADKKDPKTFIVTCATGELGSAAARLLACDNNLILTGRNVSKLQKLQEELKANHPWHYEISTLDYSSNDSIAHFKDNLDKSNSSISGIVLISPRPRFYGKELLQEEHVWMEVFQTTFTGPLEVLKGVLPHLSNGSKIVAIAGTSSVQFLPDSGPTCVIRRMWTAYTKALSHQFGPQGISINAISPGVVLTNFHQERIQKQANAKGLSYEEQMAQEVANIPLRRLADPQEIAQTIRFLLSEESNFIDGTNLIIDGGFTGSY